MLSYDDSTLLSDSSNATCRRLTPPHEVPMGAPMLIIVHCLTIALIGTYARMFDRRLDTSHPVFAVVSQELKFLMTCETSQLLLITVNWLTHSEWALKIYAVLGTLVILFHSSTWLVVSYLR